MVVRGADEAPVLPAETPNTSVDAGRVALEPLRAEPTTRVSHLTYAVRSR